MKRLLACLAMLAAALCAQPVTTMPPLTPKRPEFRLRLEQDRAVMVYVGE